MTAITIDHLPTDRDLARRRLELDVHDALARLPHTSDGIAAHFGWLGITGSRIVSEDCPLARWLAGQLGATRVTVGAVTVVFDRDGVWLERPLEGACAEFVDRFDGGQWPNLIDPAGCYEPVAS